VSRITSCTTFNVFAYFRSPLTWRELARRTVADTLEDDCPGLAAQLAFYFFLSVFPALLFVVSLLGYVPVETRLAEAVGQLESFLPQEILQFLREQIDEALAGRQGGLLTIGIVGAIWSSSSAVTAIITALNRAYDIDEWRPWWKRRLLAVALTIALSVFVVVAFVFVVGGGDLAALVAERLGFTEWMARVWTIAQWMLAIALVVAAVDLVYYLAPNADTPFVWVTPGALLATILWLLTSVGFKVYVQNLSNYTAVHGTIGAIVVLMLWFYLSGFALLVGAELNAEIDKALHPGQRQRPGERKQIGPAADVAASVPRLDSNRMQR
jgi:membrane protein